MTRYCRSPVSLLAYVTPTGYLGKVQWIGTTSQEEEVKIGEDQRLQLLPKNEEKEEILETAPTVEKAKLRHLRPNLQESASEETNKLDKSTFAIFPF